MKSETLYVRRLSKYGNQILLNNISFTAHEGEIIGFVGEHSSGAPVLLKILCGEETADSGSIFLFGNKQRSLNNNTAKSSIFFIDEKRLLLDGLDVSENLILNKDHPFACGLVRKRIAEKYGMKILSDYDLHINIHEKIYTLTDYEKTVLAIIKAVSCGAKVLLIPNHSITVHPVWRKELMHLLRKVADRGVCILMFVPEADDIAPWLDHLYIMRNGRIEGSFFAGEIEARMADIRVKEVQPFQNYRMHWSECDHAEINLRNLTVGSRHFPEISIARGELVCFVRENGHVDKTIISVLAGQVQYQGSIEINGKAVSINNPHDALVNGIAYLPTYDEDNSFHNNLTISDHIALFDPKTFSKFGFFKRRLLKFACRQYFKDTGVRMEYCNFSPELLNAHQRNELMLIRIKMLKPRILLLDDSYTNCDLEMRRQIDRLIQYMLNDGVTIITGEMPKITQELFKIRTIII